MEGICQVSFIKVKDGSNRVIYCTLNYGFIPKQYENSINKILGETPPDVDILPIWDITEGKWKSFRISKMNFFVTSDELEKENKSGHSSKTNINKILKERKDKQNEEFLERVDKLKEKAQEAKENINNKNVNNTLQTARDIINKLRTEAEEKRKGNIQ